MALVSVNNLTMSFSDRDIFSAVSFQVEQGDKVGLIGVNGAGKTTLFKALTGEEAASDGQVAIGKNTKVGYMQQHALSGSDLTLYDEVMTVFARLFAIENRLEEIQSLINSGYVDEKLLLEQQNLQTEYENNRGLTYRSLARSAILGLGFCESDMSLPCSLLSGGQKSKVSLCKLLLSGANLLLLDEPTNHLDIKSVNWLENWLCDFSGSFIVISHDRYFLNKVTNRTFELERGHFYQSDGNYSRYAVLKQERQKSEQRRYDNTMNEVHRIEGIIEQQKRFNRERNYITIASKQKSIDRLLDGLEKPESELSSIRFRFTAAEVSGNDVLICQSLAKSFDGKELFRNVDLHIKRQERVFLVGENGCGKSTLLKIILGYLRRDSGRVIPGVGVKIGYFDQALAELSCDKTVLDEVWDSYRAMNESEVRRALAAFLFKGEDVFKIMNKLSGGEKARVALLKLMLSGANFLILDEPTNHLDIKSREALENAFDDYDGTLLVVSHDRYFINRLATRIIHLGKDGAESFNGNYDYYIEHLTEPDKSVKASEKPKENTYKKQKERESEIRRTKGKIARLEKQIDDLDEIADALQQEINDPDNAADYEKILELTNQLHENTEKQEERMLEWQELNEQLENLLKT
ncbi:MAG: ABC-F family ATP-binding cassette domain-containing protein [Oscillospiraceae bacterium]|nr:ABC-F family ATP-binding cassette domain-containing protein [Oscillospiraceae bacterium]